MKKQNWFDVEPFGVEGPEDCLEKTPWPKDWFEEETFDPAADLPVLLRTLDAAMAHRRPGTGRAHLTPLNDTDLYHLDYDHWYSGTFHDLPHKTLALVDTAGGTLAAPGPNPPLLRPPFGDYEGWTVWNRRQGLDLQLSEDYYGIPWDVRNPTMFYIFRDLDGSFSYDRWSLPKRPVYWQILDCARPDFPGTAWALAVNAELPITDPDAAFTRPCRGFVTDGTAKTLTLTDNYDALAMFREAVGQYLHFLAAAANQKED